MLAKDNKNRPFIEIECEDADQWEVEKPATKTSTNQEPKKKDKK